MQRVMRLSHVVSTVRRQKACRAPTAELSFALVERRRRTERGRQRPLDATGALGDPAFCMDADASIYRAFVGRGSMPSIVSRSLSLASVLVADCLCETTAAAQQASSSAPKPALSPPFAPAWMSCR